MARRCNFPRKWRSRLLWISILLLSINFGTLAFKSIWSSQKTDSAWFAKAASRKLLSTVEWEKCDYEVGHARNYSIDSSDWYTPASAYGWVVAYILAILVVFVALAIVCDDFFVPSLEVISERLDLSEDVAGATFMAAGSSAPELFTSIAGVTVESDVGVGTIVGSAVFNLLGIVALSAAFAGKVLHLDWRPLARDSLFYSLSIIGFIVFAWDTKFELYESVIMLLMYFAYIVLMKFNPQLMDLLAKIGKKSIHPRENGAPGAPYIDSTETPKIEKNHPMGVKGDNPENVAFAGVKSQPGSPATPEHRRFSHVKKGQIAAIAQGKAEGDSPKQDRKVSKASTTAPTITETDLENGMQTVNKENGINNHKVDPKGDRVTSSTDSGKSPDPLFCYKDNNNQSPVEEEEDEPSIVICPCLPPIQVDLPSKPDTKYCLYNWFRFALGWLLFIISLPFMIMFTWTIPNCAKPRLQKYYLMSFTMSIVWIALLSFAMVTLVGRCGCILGVDRFTMGLVIVAIGTSVPDALSSILVARDGYGDMAVSNAIGSNVFDIDLGLGLPFVISIIIRGMKPVNLLSERDQQLYDAGKIPLIPHVKYGFILLVILVVTLAIFVLTRFRLNKTLGTCLVTLYFIFVVYSYIQDIYCDHNC